MHEAPIPSFYIPNKLGQVHRGINALTSHQHYVEMVLYDINAKRLKLLFSTLMEIIYP
jgi:hypothetical protein